MADGGTSGVDNLQLLCKKCNRRKAGDAAKLRNGKQLETNRRSIPDASPILRRQGGEASAPHINDLLSTTNDQQTTTTDQPLCAFEKDFLTFWEAYPLKVGKKAALKAYQARRRAGAEAVEIIAGLARYLTYKKATNERHHNPATFLGPQELYAEAWTVPEAATAPERKGNGVGEPILDRKFKGVWKPEITERRAAAGTGGNIEIKLPGAEG
jgi:hypothetical protein